METSIKILILEHDPNDIELLQYQLKKSGLDYISIVVETKGEYETALSHFLPDIILSDYSLPSFDGLSAFRFKQTMLPDVPFIIVSGTIGEENAVELIKMGVTDYALKEKLYQIPLKLQRALNEAADKKLKCLAEKQLKEREEQLQKIMDLSLDVICTVDQDGKFVTVGAASKYVWGYIPEELIGKRVIDLVHPEDMDRTYKAILELKNGVDMINFENRYACKDGQYVIMYWSARWDGAESLGYSIARDATDIKKAEEELHTQHTLVNNILEGISDGFFAVDYNWNVTYWNKEAERLLHTPKEKILNKNLWDTFKEECAVKSYAEYHRAIAEQVSITFEDFYTPLDAWFEITASPSKDKLVVSFRDITSKKRKQQFMLLEREMLELYTVKKTSLADAITNLLEKLQAHYPEMYCTVLRVNEDSLKHWGSGILPGALHKAIREIDFSKTSCGTAVALKEKIAITDIGTDLLWQEHNELFLQEGIHACTAYPICDANNKVMAILAVFFIEPRETNPAEEQVTDFIINLLKPLVESKIAALALQASEKKYRNLFDLSPIPMWVFDAKTLYFLDVNEAAIKHYGYSRTEFYNMTLKDIRPKEDVEAFIDLVKADADLTRFNWGTHKHVKKNGDIIFVEISVSLIDLNGKQARVVLASDISERIKYIHAIETQNKNLREIAWMQSHVVRAPLARLMGLTSLLKDNHTGRLSTEEVLDLIIKSSCELDEIVKSIVRKSEKV